jgi:type II secretory pathway component PulF
LAVAWVPSLLAMYEGHPPKYVQWLDRATAVLWTPLSVPLTNFWISLAIIPPMVLVALAIVWWYRSSRALVVDAAGARRWLGWLPVAPRIATHSRSAALAEILGLLVEQDVPVHDAIVLAADCTGDQGLMNNARQVSAAIVSGAPADQYAKLLDDFPPLLAWLSVSKARQPTTVTLARHCADTYRRRVARETQWLRDFLPIWLIAVVGGLVVFAYALSIFLPLTELLERLSHTGSNLRMQP